MYFQNSINHFAINTYTRLTLFFVEMCPRLMFQAAKHNVYIEPNTQRVYLRHAVLFYTFSESRKRRYFLFYSILFILFNNIF